MHEHQPKSTPAWHHRDATASDSHTTQTSFFSPGTVQRKPEPFFAKSRHAISALSSQSIIQRAKREDLAIGQSVYFPKKTVIKGWAIEPNTKGIVRLIPEHGDVEIEITTGQFEKETVKVGPGLIEIATGEKGKEEDESEAAAAMAEFEPNERKIGEWGSIWEVRPGIGVEVPKGNESYLEFIIGQLDIIGGTKTGKTMIERFSENGSFRKVKDQSGPYKDLTLIIGQPPERQKDKIKKQFNDNLRVIKTGGTGGRKPSGQKIFGDQRIPEIILHNRPEEGREDYVGDPAKKVKVIPAGITGHKDFYATQPFDVILYHEMVHALVSQLGVSSRLAEIDTQIDLGYKIPEGIAVDDHVEEQLVVGIMGGLGLSFSENAYRREKEYEQRKTYKAVGIEEGSKSKGKLEDSDMDKLSEDTVLQEIYRALRKAGLSEAQALYVVGKGDKPGE